MVVNSPLQREEALLIGGLKRVIQVPYVWAFSTYFAEGFPYTIIRSISSIYFRDMNVSLQAIGLTSLFGLPWVLKFLWGPHVDRYGTKRGWMLVMQGGLIAMVLVVAFMAPLPSGVRVIAALLFAGAFLAATNDVAIDGYYMEALDENGQAKYVGYRVMVYRMAMMYGGVIVTVGATMGWSVGFLLAAASLGVVFLYNLAFLPKVEAQRRPPWDLIKGVLRIRLLVTLCLLALAIWIFRWLLSTEWVGQARQALPILAKVHFSGWVGIGLLVLLVLLAAFRNRIRDRLMRDRKSFYSRVFLSYMDRERIGAALAFIILIRTGEFMLSSMAAPFLVDLGIKIHIGWISKGVGLPCSIAGALAGGWLISKFSLRRMILPFLLAQNLTNLIYMLLALGLDRYVMLNTGAESPVSIGISNLALVAAVHGFDQFASGLGTSVLVTFLMRTCLPEHKAAHFAIGTGLMNVSGVLSGVMSGFLAEWLGYGAFFGISFLASLPGMALILFLPFLEPEREPGRS